MRRRAFLTSTAAVGVAGVAGCLGGDGGGGTGQDGDSGGTPGEDGGGAAADGGGTVADLPTPVAGDPDAPVTVAVFEDFACPHCRSFATDVHPKLVADYVDPGVVRYEHHDFPIPVHDRWSWQAPSAARAVQDGVGDDAFFDAVDRLFADGWRDGRADYSVEFVETVAADVGADPETVATAAIEERYRPVLEADRAAGVERGVRGTPTVFVDGAATDGYDYATISAAIEAAR